MSLRGRIAVIAAAAVAVAVVVASAALYVVTARTLRDAVDRSLVELARDLRDRPRDAPRLVGPRAGRFGGPGGFVQVVTAEGRVLGQVGAEELPVGDAVTDVAAGERGAFFATVEVDGEPVRVLTVPVRRGLAAQVARPLDEVQDALTALRRQLALGALAGVGLAAVLGALVAQRAIRPVDDLTRLAEEVAATKDLSRRIGLRRDDEIGRLARTLDTMLANLEEARRAQEQLVADASHELRTPLTSLRTNVEVLADVEQLDAADRRALVADVVAQLDEFSRLVAALVELARGARPPQAPAPVRLDELVESVTARARPAGSDRRIDVTTEPTTVVGEADRLERAVANLVDNAVKYGGDGPIEVHVADGTVTVSDRGPGVPPEHLPHVFERFYRAPEARGAPGSGLGLAIVAQVAAAHGGSVEAANRPGGGATFTLRLPTHATAPPSPHVTRRSTGRPT